MSTELLIIIAIACAIMAARGFSSLKKEEQTFNENKAKALEIVDRMEARLKKHQEGK